MFTAPRAKLLTFMAILAISTLRAPTLRAEIAEEQLGARVCSGYDPLRGKWGWVPPGIPFPSDANCSEGYAFVASGFILGTSKPARNTRIFARCCPLPVGVLTDQHFFSPDLCPEDSVATGLRTEPDEQGCGGKSPKDCKSDWENAVHLLRCTKIDTTRFELGRPDPGLILGFHLMLEPGNHRYTSRGRIPLGLRYGIIRDSLFDVEGGGYVGTPWGSILTAKLGKNSFLFQPLLWKSGPRKGQSVKIYPDCLSLKNPFSPYPICITANGTEYSIPKLSSVEILQRHLHRIYVWLGAIVLLELRVNASLSLAESSSQLLAEKDLQFSNGIELRSNLENHLLKPLQIVESQICALESYCSNEGRFHETAEILALLKEQLALLSSSSNRTQREEVLNTILGEFSKRSKALQQLPFLNEENDFLSENGFIGRVASVAGIDQRSHVINQSILESLKALNRSL